MAVSLSKETEKRILGSIRHFFAEKLETEIGDLKASLVLEFFVKEIGPSIYNQAIADAQAYFQEKTSDLAGSRFEPEFGYWKK